MPPCDPSPYATIASRLADVRAHRPPAPNGARTRAALRAFLERHHPSAQSLSDAEQRVSNAKAERFTDTHNDYRPVPKPVRPFTTKRD